MVAPGSGGPRDLVRHGVNGLLYTPGDEVELRRSIQRLSGQPDLRAALARAARGSVLSRSWSAVCDQLLEHYAEVVRESAPSAVGAGR